MLTPMYLGPIQAQSPTVRISQLYGGGGNSGAALNSDFIELFNADASPADLSGWSVQYAAAEGTDWQVAPLSGQMAPGGYLLVKQAGGIGGSDAGTTLESPNIVGAISMSATKGKVALVASTDPISSRADANVVDFVGYGAANEFEGDGVAGGASNTAAIFRAGNGCQDTNQNQSDFSAGAPQPRNSASPVNSCAAPPTDTPLPTDTPTELPTNTPLPTDTPTAIPTETPTETIMPTNTPTIAPPTETATFTPTATATLTPTLTPTESPTMTPIITPTASTAPITPTNTISPVTPTPTLTATIIVTSTAAPSDTPIIVDTATATTIPITTTPITTTPITTTPITTTPITTTPTTVPAALPSIRIAEFLADPKAAADNQAEWLELVSSAAEPVNLNGWRLADQGTDSHVISGDLWIQPGQRLLLARSADAAVNGGVAPVYVYSGLQLANSADELLLIAPDGREVDRVIWGGASGLAVQAGVSLERTNSDDPAVWAPAQSAWPGSAGDWGSPGAAYAPPPATATPTFTPVVTPAQSPTPTLTPTPTPLVVDTATPLPGPMPIYLSEIMANPNAVSDTVGEYIELWNGAAVPVNLRGWTLLDLGSDRHTIAADLIVPPGGYVVLARSADPALNGGVQPDYVYSGFSLANGDDEAILLAPNGTEVDRFMWESGVGITPPNGASLERDLLDPARPWSAAHSAWPGSVGDLGSPGTAYVAPIVVDTATPTPTNTVFLETPTLIPTLDPSVRLYLSELMIDPAAVGDAMGEWAEIFNPGPQTVNLRGWRLIDLGGDSHRIDVDLFIAPGQYLVLARNGDATLNGNVTPAYTYSDISLANSADELLLLTPDGREMDRVTWGGDTGIKAPRGASLERTSFDAANWGAGSAPWPGSMGDAGTPGMAYAPPIATATATIVTPLPDAPTATSTATALTGATWPLAAAPGALRIDEIAYRGSDDEYVELFNDSAGLTALADCSIGDAEVPGSGEGMYALPDDVVLAPAQKYLIARNGAAFRQRWGRSADAQFDDSDPTIPSLRKRTDLARGSWALKDGGDEVVLLNAAGEVEDAVAYGSGNYAALGLTGELSARTDFTLQRVPGAPFPTVRDVRHRFMAAPPQPFDARSLPDPIAAAHPGLDQGLMALWGSLGAYSNFTSDFTAPPHYLVAASGAEGLDFVALADPMGAPNELAAELMENMGAAAQPQPIRIPAWAWQSEAGDEAIIYSTQPTDIADQAGLRQFLLNGGGVAQWTNKTPPVMAGIVATFADDLDAPSNLKQLVKRWQLAAAPLIAGGNTNPPLPGLAPPAPRYTGLAAAGPNLSALLEALQARRGWLTSSPGIWLTLRAELPDGQARWMGQQMQPADNVRFDIFYGDKGGEMAGLALWRNGSPVAQLDFPPADGRWSVTLNAEPDSLYFGVVTQPDGDFAVTAPIRILAAPSETTQTGENRTNQSSASSGSSTPGGAAKSNNSQSSGIDATYGQASGPPGSLAAAKLVGLDRWVEFRAVVIAPPGLFNNSFYVAEPAPNPDSPLAGLGINVYLRSGGFPALQEGDWVLIRGVLDTFRGEMEVLLQEPSQIWRIGPDDPLQPLPISVADINESLEARLVTFDGVVQGWSRDSIYVRDPSDPNAESVRVTVRSSLDWRRPYVNKGETWRVTGIVSQFATEAPWNDGYRVLVRYATDLERIDD